MPDVEIEEVGTLTEEDLLARVSPDPLPAVFITAKMFAESSGYSPQTALRKLLEKKEAGIIAGRKALVDGRERWIFY